ncbi:fructosamine kinase family protein [Parapedobacter soli]|uniref:fructosamine kinase family protein n=1 Tax=Parapedobacter soli TaxID=416955 RepID=UPI0021C96ECC|nr:fructosamine kinase family protein [Parapedobacter soli]
MVLSQSLFQTLVAAIKDSSPHDFTIQSIVPVSGGDINRAYRIQTPSAAYFLKVNNTPDANRMFLAESDGLALIRRVPGVRAPRTFTVGQAHGEAFLLMEWLATAYNDVNEDTAQELLGRMVASLHRKQSASYGLDHGNFIGRLPQSNAVAGDWTAFFIHQRLQAQLDMAKPHLTDSHLQKQFDQLFAKLASLYPYEPPSLLHGDLWGGNYLITEPGKPALIDPAVYYGNREMDIAMTRLFGGFSGRFYAAYHEAYPLQPGWRDRVDLWNLYPLLVHLNLFGTSYLDAVQRRLKKYL